jgi:hypothetical protein
MSGAPKFRQVSSLLECKILRNPNNDLFKKQWTTETTGSNLDEWTVFENRLGHDFLESSVLLTKVRDFGRGGFALGVTEQALLSGFEELLAGA